jgi:hypothetical protein
LGILLAYGIFKGIKKRLIIEFASFSFPFVGIYIAVKFSNIVGFLLARTQNSQSSRLLYLLYFIVVGIFC